MFIGFLLVCLSYIVCGTIGSIGFQNAAMFDGKDVAQNCLNMFSPKSGIATFIRLTTFLQLFASMSLLFACERS